MRLNVVSLRVLKSHLIFCGGGKNQKGIIFMMRLIPMKLLLEAGVHFGHQTRRWNPKMAEYIFTQRNGIYIIDLQKTVKKLEEAYKFISELAADGKKILFVGTKKQAQAAIKEEAINSGSYYVNSRWLGGMLTNFSTIKQRVKRLKQLREMESNGTFDLLPKKEVLKLDKEIDRLEKYLGGVKDMAQLPDALFVVDPKKEHIAVAEARKLKIPIIAIVDTNCNPDEIDYIIPGNDDAIRAIKLICAFVANTIKQAKEGEELSGMYANSDDGIVFEPVGENSINELAVNETQISI